MQDSSELQQTLSKQSDSIMALEDVVGVGEAQCDNAPCIKVFLARDNAATVAKIGEILTNIPYQVEVTGEFKATR